ncbi:MAG TPA: hypothetical protein VNO22_10580 [Planctomycetota bacterium]|nr:hypothetical protein [Planctomycetota bacterium]
MKRWMVAGIAAAAAGCAGVSKQELETVRAELLAHDERKAAELKQELTGVKEEYVLVQKLEQRVQRQLEEMEKLRQRLEQLAQEIRAAGEVARVNAVRSLEFEEKLMADRLAQLRALIEELKKPGGAPGQK